MGVLWYFVVFLLYRKSKRMNVLLPLSPPFSHDQHTYGTTNLRTVEDEGSETYDVVDGRISSNGIFVFSK